jgi:diguanylate cyclase (GGDEF)-like protein
MAMDGALAPPGVAGSAAAAASVTPRRLVPPAVVVVVAVAALLGCAWSWAAPAVPIGPADLRIAALLLVLEIGYVEALRLARPRRARAVPPRRGGLTAVVVVAGALLLPPAAAVVLPIVGHLHEAWRLGTVRPRHRVGYGIAAAVLAVLAVWAVRVWGGGTSALDGGLSSVLLALAVFALVDCGLMALLGAASEPRSSRRRALGGFDDNLLDLAALGMGALTAAAVVVNPWLVPFVLPTMLVMHRAMLVPQLAEDACIDGKTGLLNATTWQERAVVDLAATRPGDGPRAVLVVDLDHFKAVNDTFGHVAGDVVLAAVADAIQGAVRARDVVGRFGGEEFVVLLARADAGGAADVEQIAQRIRRAVAALRVPIDTPAGRRVVAGLRVSVGAGVQRAGGHPAARGELGELVKVADAAVYAAKRGGRDQVRVSALTPRESRPTAAGDVITLRGRTAGRLHPDERRPSP